MKDISSPADDQPRILVVDDDPGMLRGVSRVLQRDYPVQCAASAAEGLEIARQWRPDLAVVDIGMPVVNGFELMKQLKKQWDIDVIMMTGNASEPDENLIRAVDDGAFFFLQKPFDRRVLKTIVARCVELRGLRRKETRHMRRMEQELDQARRFQESFLPPTAGNEHGYDIAARYIACTELAGDLYDYAADDKYLALLVADVVGHGVSAALLTGVVKSAFRAGLVDSFQPLGVVSRIREGVRAFDDSRFVTLFCGRLDHETNELLYVNAGHPAPLLVEPDRPARTLDVTAPMVCPMLDDLPYDSQSVPLGPDSCLLVYTDGVIEAEGPDDEMFGSQRLIQWLEGTDERSGALLDKLLGELDQFSAGRPSDDDITLMTVRAG